MESQSSSPFTAHTHREAGWGQLDPTVTLSTDLDSYGALEFAQLVCDAIDIKSDGTGMRDSLMESYLAKPIQFAIVDASDVTDLSWTTKIDCTLALFPVCRGERRTVKP